jgi:hypothetical protein
MVLRLERADLDDYNDHELSAYKLNQEMVENNNPVIVFYASALPPNQPKAK